MESSRITNENPAMAKLTPEDIEYIDMGENEVSSYGDYIVGIKFNPSEDPQVANIKKCASSLINAIKDAQRNQKSGNHMKTRVFEDAIIKTLEAQMLGVKALFL